MSQSLNITGTPEQLSLVLRYMTADAYIAAGVTEIIAAVETTLEPAAIAEVAAIEPVKITLDQMNVFNGYWHGLVATGEQQPAPNDEHKRLMTEWANGGFQPLVTAAEVFNDCVMCGAASGTHLETCVDYVAPATTAAATTTTPPATTHDLTQLAKDSTGVMVPWDARIHGDKKAINGDGSWRYIKSIDKVNLVPQVEAELRALVPAAPATTTTTETPAPPSQTAATEATAAALATQVATTTTTAGPMTFPELVTKIQPLRGDGTITNAKLHEVAVALKIANFGILATRADLIPQAATMLGV